MTENDNNLKPKFKIIELIKEIPDPRIERCQKHPFVSIVFISFVTTLCGANNWIEVESLGEVIQDWIKEYVPLPFGIPSHDTFGRVFSLIRPESFRQFLEKWVNFVRQRVKGELINFDGKTLRGTKDAGSALHLLNAWSMDNGICIGQLPVDEKTNEIKIVPELIKLLDLKDCIVTTDALNTQKEIAKAIIGAGADYALPIKRNHADLYDDVEFMFENALKKEFKGVDADYHETLEKSHGRIESRKFYMMDGEDVPNKELWEGFKTVGIVIRERTIKEKTEKEIAYYLMSTEIDAKLLERCSRGHWGVENGLHWRLDVIFREDESRYRDDVGAQNLSIVRKMSLGALSRDKTVKGGIQTKRLRAAASPAYREHVLKNFL